MHIIAYRVCQPVCGAGVNAGDVGPCPAARPYRVISSSSTHGGTWVDKRKRQSAILELVERQPIGSQEELRLLLHKRGWHVTQSTLSRDLRELRLARVPTS